MSELRCISRHSGSRHARSSGEDSIRSNLAAEAAANENAAKNSPGATDPAVPHLLDSRIHAYLQIGKDAEAKKIVDQAGGINKLAAVRLETD